MERIYQILEEKGFRVESFYDELEEKEKKKVVVLEKENVLEHEIEYAEGKKDTVRLKFPYEVNIKIESPTKVVLTVKDLANSCSVPLSINELKELIIKLTRIYSILKKEFYGDVEII